MELVPVNNAPIVMTDTAIAKVREFEKRIKELPQVPIYTNHVLHGGMYARTIIIPAGTLLTGAHIIVPTVCITNGHLVIFTDDVPLELQGYHVIPATEKRKTALYAIAESFFTMLFPTTAKTLEEAETYFTDEVDELSARKQGSTNFALITGE